MTEEQSFDTRAFGGFDKQQVLDYIAQLISDQQAAVVRLEETIRQLEEKTAKDDQAMAESARLLAEQSASLDNLNRQNRQLTESAAEQSARVAQLTEHNRRLTAALTEEQEANKKWELRVDEANRAMSEKCRENEELTKTAEEFARFEERQAQIQTQLNELLAKAHARGEQIIAKAKADGAEIIAEANGVAAATYTACARLKDSLSILRQATEQVQDDLADPSADFETHLSQIRQAALNEETPSAILDRFIEQQFPKQN